MNFDFSDDQKLLKEQVRKFLTDKCPTKVVRRVLDGNETHADEVWKGLVDLGVPAHRHPRGVWRARPLAARTVRRRRGGRPCRGTGAVRHVGRAGDRGAEARGLGRAEEEVANRAGGRQGDRHARHRRGPAAAQAARHPHDLRRRPAQRQESAGGRRRSGDVRRRAGQHRQGRAIAPCRWCWSISRRRPLPKKRVETIDPARKHAELTFKDASAELLGAEGEGWRTLERLYDAAAVYFAFAQVGGAGSRDVDGARLCAAAPGLRPRHRFLPGDQAQACRLLRQARAGALQRLLRRHDADRRRGRPAAAAAAARIAATDAYDFAPKENIQTHGGIGFTWEADTQFHYRRARVMALALGEPDGLERQASEPSRTRRTRPRRRTAWTSTILLKKPAFRKEVRTWREASQCQRASSSSATTSASVRSSGEILS